MSVLQPPLGHEGLRIWVDVRVSGECPAEDGILLDLDIPTLRKSVGADAPDIRDNNGALRYEVPAVLIIL